MCSPQPVHPPLPNHSYKGITPVVKPASMVLASMVSVFIFYVHATLFADALVRRLRNNEQPTKEEDSLKAANRICLDRAKPSTGTVACGGCGETVPVEESVVHVIRLRRRQRWSSRVGHSPPRVSVKLCIFDSLQTHTVLRARCPVAWRLTDSTFGRGWRRTTRMIEYCPTDRRVQCECSTSEPSFLGYVLNVVRGRGFRRRCADSGGTRDRRLLSFRDEYDTWRRRVGCVTV